MDSINITLVPLQPDDREQFILDNQWAFKYGAQQEFGLRDTRTEEGEEVISRNTIENSIDGENAETYRILLDGEKVGGVVLFSALRNILCEKSVATIRWQTGAMCIVSMPVPQAHSSTSSVVETSLATSRHNSLWVFPL